jgi:4-amino-4-deoxy-L-arabinose transferase-like glycosyltransferase
VTAGLPGWALRHERKIWPAALALITLAGIAWRLARAARAPQLPDEEICIGIAARVLQPGADWPLHGGDHPLLGIYLLAASASLFGPSLGGYRALGAIAGGLTPLVVALAVARQASRREALVAAALLAADPLHAGLSVLAFEIPYQLLFGTLAWWCLATLPGGGRRALLSAAALLGLAFLCSESAALLGLGWAVVLVAEPKLRVGLGRAALAQAAAVFLLVVLPDVVYNLRATRADYRYVNYADHIERFARPTVSLQGAGFFLRDAFNATLAGHPRVWTDYRCEYPRAGVALGLLLLLGAVHAWGPRGDPSGGLWRVPPLLFVLLTSFGGPAGPSGLDRPVWTWPLPSLPLVTAAAARMLCLRWRRAWPLFVPLLLALLLPAPDSSRACDRP